MGTKKSVGYDNIPRYIFKGCFDILAKPLTNIFNILSKKGVASNMEKYRLINILNPLAKIFKTVICNSLIIQLPIVYLYNNMDFLISQLYQTCVFSQTMSQK